MIFEHTEERRMLADTLTRFIAGRYPFAARLKASASSLGYDADTWRQFADLGIIGALFNEADGGFGGAGFDIAVVFEALGRGLVVEPFLNALMAGGVVAAARTGAQRELLAAIVDGSLQVAFAHGEPEGHYAPSHVATRAQRNGDGWILDGCKAVVRHGGSAALLLVSARVAGAAGDEDGISLFLVPADSAGLTVRGTPNIDGSRSARLTFGQVRAGPETLVGADGGAFALIEQALGRGVLALCAEAVGAMDVTKAATLEYLQTRKQFGAPIGSFQALQHRMADLLLEIEQARSAVINAAAALGGDRRARERTLSAAKYTIGRAGALVAEEAIQMHGAIGMTWELPLAHYAKRLIMIDHQLGDEDHHLARYIALGRL